MSIIPRIIYRLRAVRIDMLRADIAAAGDALRRLEARQLAALHDSGKNGARTSVPHFLRRSAR